MGQVPEGTLGLGFVACRLGLLGSVMSTRMYMKD